MYGKQLLKQVIENYNKDPAANNKAFMVHKLLIKIYLQFTYFALHYLQVYFNWPSEYLISISGTYGNFGSMLTITSLSFTTNGATYGPFGTGSGTSFSIPINNNTVVGFHGRAGHYLDAIGIFVTTI